MRGACISVEQMSEAMVGAGDVKIESGPYIILLDQREYVWPDVIITPDPNAVVYPDQHSAPNPAGLDVSFCATRG